jgi:hypothetical protein
MADLGRSAKLSRVPGWKIHGLSRQAGFDPERTLTLGYGCGETTIDKLKGSLLSPTLIAAFSLTWAIRVGALTTFAPLKILPANHTSAGVFPWHTVISIRQSPEATANCSPALANTLGADFSPPASSAIVTAYVGVAVAGSACALNAPVKEPATSTVAIQRPASRQTIPESDNCKLMSAPLVG